MSQMIIDSKDVLKDIYEYCDCCVIGTGAGGGVIAKELQCAGLNVIAIEEGPYLKPEEFYQDFFSSLDQLYYDFGLRSMVGRSYIPIMHAKCVGGTTLVNSGISFRLPENIFNQWKNKYGITHSYENLIESFKKVEKIINVEPTSPEVMGRHNELFKKGCESLGLKSSPIYRNTRNCNGCGFCINGCPNYAHMSIDLTYIPAGLKAGLKVYSSCRAEKIIVDGGEARGVEGFFIDPKSKKKTFRLKIKSKFVVLSGGAVGSPLLLQKSGIHKKEKNVGKYFLNHPAAAIMGIFDEEVQMWNGVPQGYQCDEFIQEGILIETAGLPPELAYFRVFGLGKDLKKRFSKYPNSADWGVMIRAKTQGEISIKATRPFLWYPLIDEDLKLLKRGLKIVADIFFAAGAKYILPGIRGVPIEIHSEKETYLIENREIKASDIFAIGNHPMGGCRMGEDEKNSVVNSNFEMHKIKNLYICDASIFPEAPGVNPQLSIMAFSDLASKILIKRYK